ncbi:MAG: D-alanyl-D-alanine carboxypeptidase [Rhodobacteraceae bacterium]|nr:D-alanyl-D-alanine carboxypeptidase [Paracoccaceae bacterium]
MLAFAPLGAQAAPYAAMVIDARSGEVLHSRNADTRLHPASLTKMMTLYVAFEAVERGQISLDTKVKISKKAAAEPPSKLGLRAGQKIALRYLIRAAAVKSANDAATAIAEAIEGSEAGFARRMNRTAKALGMNRTTFKNAHGLTESGHLSTARDMTTMGRRLFYDYPEYYNLFSRKSTDAGLKQVNNTNRRLLGAYRGADGIKTGYTRAAGFNLVASAERGQERIIATVFGGRSTATRNARVAELLDMGFRRAPSRVAVRKPAKPVYPPAEGAPAGKTVRTVLAVAKSPRPTARPGAEPDAAVLVALQENISQTLALVDLEEDAKAPIVDLNQQVATLIPDRAPRPRPAEAVMTGAAKAATAPAPDPDAVEVVTRLSTSGGRHFGINVGRFGSRHQAERVLLQTALLELGTLDEALRKVVKRSGGFDANFVGLSADEAELACRRLTARNVECAPIGPT